MLVVISPGFPKNEQDSTCLPAVQQYIKALKQVYGSEQLLVVSLHYPFSASSYQWHSISVQAMGGKNKKGLHRLLTLLRAFLVLHKLQKKQPALHILCLWLHDAALLGSLFSRFTKSKVLYWQQGQDVYPTNKFIKWLGAKPQQLACISEHSAELLNKNHYLRAAHLFSNGILPDRQPSLNTGPRKIAVMGAGSLIVLKNYKLFIDVLVQVAKFNPNFQFVHVGEGIEANELKHYAQQVGISEQLNFMGNVPHQQVLELMNQSLIFLHTSQFEGSATVLAEALYMGCKVVTTIGLSSPEPKNVFVCKNLDALVKQTNALLQGGDTAERVVSFSLLDTAKNIKLAFEQQ